MLNLIADFTPTSPNKNDEGDCFVPSPTTKRSIVVEKTRHEYMNLLTIRQNFLLECGEVLPEIEIAYCTFGTINAAKNNIIWVFHALTSNANVMEWWPGVVGEHKLIDPQQYFIVCANMLGSCYGSTGPESINPSTGKKYGKDFPNITVRDMVHAHQLLQQHLGIKKIKLGIGGSMGGQQVLEWAIIDPTLFEKISAIACNASHLPWIAALNEAQRMAIEADATLYDGTPRAGQKGLEAARAMGMLLFRNYEAFGKTQADSDEKIDNYRAASYQRYQGKKLSQRFSALAYIAITKAMDSHDVGRHRGGMKLALQKIEATTLIIGIESDIMFPVQEQIALAAHIPNASIEIIDSTYGHDGFLIENDILTEKIGRFLQI